jgi:mRNA-degrading endonuclease RelE of RelBE toxin-antitoxin system
MPYEIRYSNEAVEQLKKLRVFDRTAILDQIEQILRMNPIIVSKSRIKRLREPAPTRYRLRVGEFRVFHDVEKEAVLIIQVLSKEDSIDYLGGLP